MQPRDSRATCRCSIVSRPSATRRKTRRFLMAPMATTGQEAIGSMGTDTPISAMSEMSKLLYTYFKQKLRAGTPIRRSTRSARNW